MATCKDCVHYKVCEDAREFDNYEVYDIMCDHFKNKADFVEDKWISVKDRLPEKEGKYLCANYVLNLLMYSMNMVLILQKFGMMVNLALMKSVKQYFLQEKPKNKPSRSLRK